MKLPIPIAEKLILLLNGGKIPSSKLKHSVIDVMIDNGILEQQIYGRSKKLIFLRSSERLNDYLTNHFGINSLHDYILGYQNEDALRSDLVEISSDSKLKKVRTFKGFLVNSYFPIQATLNDEPILINPNQGSFYFVYDFENFRVPDNITIVGVENPENFRNIYFQKYLFTDINPLFVSRYPQNQSRDLIKWLQNIPNKYLHFGDFDFAGINIYLNEYKKYLGEKAAYFIPDNIEFLLKEYGNIELFHKQKINLSITTCDEQELLCLIDLINKNHRGLEQEIFIKDRK